jgi:hypothetical protein
MRLVSFSVDGPVLVGVANGTHVAVSLPFLCTSLRIFRSVVSRDLGGIVFI